MCTQPIVAKKEEDEEPEEEEEEDRGMVEEEGFVDFVGRAYPEDRELAEEIWEELDEMRGNSGDENGEEAEEDEEVELKEEETVPEEVVGAVGLRQRMVGNPGQQATVGNGQAGVSCLFDGD